MHWLKGKKVLETCVRNPPWGSFHLSWKNKAVVYSEIIWANINKEGNRSSIIALNLKY